jgi:hypothetical protein
MARPTVREVEMLIEARDVGARLRDGAWRSLPGGRWAVPVGAYMASVIAPGSPASTMPDVVIAPKPGGGWRVDREARVQPEEQERIFHNAAALEAS